MVDICPLEVAIFAQSDASLGATPVGLTMDSTVVITLTSTSDALLSIPSRGPRK